MNDIKNRVTKLLTDFMKEYESLDLLSQNIQKRETELKEKEDGLQGRENKIEQDRVLIEKEKQVSRERKESLDRRETLLNEKIQKVNTILNSNSA